MESLGDNSVFEPAQAAILMKAYQEAIHNLDAYPLDQQIKARLATMVLTIARTRINSGGGLASHEDALSVASIASHRLMMMRPC